jgi:hypothetical protein
VVPVLETIDSIDELRAAADDPEALLERIVALKQTKQTAEESVPPEHEVACGDVECVLSQIQLDVEELERQMQDLDQAAMAEPLSMEQLNARLDLAHAMHSSEL